jgi:hypothetical protein
MNTFRVWLSPSGSAWQLRVDGIENTKWLLNRLSRSFVFKTAQPVNEDHGPGIRGRLGEPAGRRGTIRSSSELRPPSFFGKTGRVTVPALSAMPREDQSSVDLDRQCVRLLRDRSSGRDLPGDQGVCDELVVFPPLMSAYPTDLPGTVPLLGVFTMQRSGQVPDKRISQKVEQRVARAGLGSQARVTVQVRNGDVTLSGTLQYDTQRKPVVRAARGVDGVRRIVDQLQLKASPKKRQYANLRPPPRNY